MKTNINISMLKVSTGIFSARKRFKAEMGGSKGRTIKSPAMKFCEHSDLVSKLNSS